MATSSLPHLSRRLALALTLAAGVLLAVVPFVALALGLKSDFLAFYTGGQVILQGETARLYDPDLHRQWQLAWVGPAERVSRFVYLPLFATVYLPIAALPLGVARALWAALSLALLAVAVHHSRRWNGLTRVERWLAVLAFPGSYGAFLVGQNSPLTLALFAALAGLMGRGRRPALMGVLAGLVLYKPQLLVGLGLLWLWQRRWRALAVFAAMGAATLLGSLAISWEATRDNLFVVSRLLDRSVGANAAVYAELLNHLPAPVARAAAGGIALAVLAALVVAWGQTRRPDRYQQAMLWLVPLLVTPYVANYDLLLLLLPLSFLAPRLPHDRPLQAVVALVWVGPAVNLLVGNVVLLAVWGALALYALCFWRVWQGRRTPTLVRSREIST